MCRRPRTLAAPMLLAGALLGVVCLGVVGSARGEDGGPRLSVQYHPPRLSVEAREASLAEVLGLIGSRLGFTVLGTRGSSSRVSLSIRDASLDDVLRLLLRGENYTLLYRAGVGAAESDPAVDKIVLSGEPSRMQAVVRAGGDPRAEHRLVDVGRDRPGPAVGAAPAVAPSAGPPSWTPETTPLLSWDPGTLARTAPDPETPPITVGEILKGHAMSAVQAQSLGNAAPAPPAPSTPPVNLEAALAQTTRRAQQDVSALVEGLAAATRSLHESLGADRK